MKGLKLILQFFDLLDRVLDESKPHHEGSHKYFWSRVFQLLDIWIEEEEVSEHVSLQWISLSF